MPYGSMDEVNKAIKGIKPAVSLEQANLIASWADKLEGKESVESPWGTAIANFKKSHHVDGGKWVRNKELAHLDDERLITLFELALAAQETAEMTSEEAFEALLLAIGEGQGKGKGRQREGGTDVCVCPKCGEELPHERGTPCAELECPKCGTKMEGKPVQLEKASKTRDGKQYFASDYLVVGDPQKPDTWHLPITKTPGGLPDHAQCGAAWAALHKGYRGNVYQGPNKGEAISKLKAIYKKNDWPLPTEAEAPDLRYFGLIELAEAPDFARNKNPDGTPAWVPIHRLGEWNDPRYDHFTMTETKMDQAIANFTTCVHRPDSPLDAQVPVDTRHQGDAACGWLLEMRKELPYLWGKPRWTDRGKQIILDQQYRYVSPRYLDDPQRGPIFMEVTLTNRDFLKMPPVDGAGPTVFLSDDVEAVIIPRKEEDMEDKIKLTVGGEEKELTLEEVQTLVATGEVTAKELADAKAELDKAKEPQETPREAITLTQPDGTEVVLTASAVAGMMQDNETYRKERKERDVRDALKVLEAKNVEPIVVQMMEPILRVLSPEADAVIQLDASPTSKAFGFADEKGEAQPGQVNLWVALNKLIEQLPARSNAPRTLAPDGKRLENHYVPTAVEATQYDPSAISLEDIEKAEEEARKVYEEQGKTPRSKQGQQDK